MPDLDSIADRRSPDRRLLPPALVLTAGRGTRLDPLTRLMAKAAVPMAGRALIERLLGALARTGVSQAVLNLHHRPETIAAVVGDGTHLGLSVRYSWEQPVLLGSAGGPRRALPLLGGSSLLIVNGDTLADIDVTGLAAAHAAGRDDGATLAVIPNPAPDHYSGLVLDDQDGVVGVEPRGAGARDTWHFIGVQVASASLFADLDDGVPAETIAGVYREVMQRHPGRIRAWRTSGRVLDAGTPRDYLDAVLSLTGGAPAVEAGAQVHPSARLDRTVVWPGATVGPRALLTECVVAGEVVVPDGFEARARILVPASLVRPGDEASVDGALAAFRL